MVTRVLFVDGNLTVYENPIASMFHEGSIPVESTVCVMMEKGSFSYCSHTLQAAIDKPGILLFSTTSRNGSIKVSKGFIGAVSCYSSVIKSVINIKYEHLLHTPVLIDATEFSSKEILFLKSIHNAMCDYISEDKPECIEIITHLSKAFFLGLEPHIIENVHIGNPSSRKESISERFLKLVSEQCSQHRDLEFYANELCITPKYLSSVISKSTGHRSLQWIEEYVIMHAKKLLKDTDLPINQISDLMNFIAPSDFCRYFRMRTGMTPKKFRDS